MLIIDGHNLIGASKTISLSDPNAKEKLLCLLDKYQKILDRKIIVVFDRKTPGGYERIDFENIEVRYPSGNETADEVIKKLIAKYTNQHGISIISSDNEIKNSAKRAHLSYQSSRSFNDEIEEVLASANDETENYLSPIEVEEWVELFQKRHNKF